MNYLHKKLITIACCMSLPVWASYHMVPLQDPVENSDDDLYRITFDLVQYAIDQEPVIKLSLYDDPLVVRTETKKAKAHVIKEVDEFFQNYSTLAPLEKELIISNAQTLQSKADVRWPFKVVGEQDDTQAQDIAQRFFDAQNRSASQLGVLAGAVPLVTYAFIESQVKADSNLFKSLPDYKSGLLGVASLQEMYEKYIAYMVQKEVDKLIDAQSQEETAHQLNTKQNDQIEIEQEELMTSNLIVAFNQDRAKKSPTKQLNIDLATFATVATVTEHHVSLPRTVILPAIQAIKKGNPTNDQIVVVLQATVVTPELLQEHPQVAPYVLLSSALRLLTLEHGPATSSSVVNKQRVAAFVQDHKELLQAALAHGVIQVVTPGASQVARVGQDLDPATVNAVVNMLTSIYRHTQDVVNLIVDNVQVVAPFAKSSQIVIPGMNPEYFAVVQAAANGAHQLLRAIRDADVVGLEESLPTTLASNSTLFIEENLLVLVPSSQASEIEELIQRSSASLIEFTPAERTNFRNIVSRALGVRPSTLPKLLPEAKDIGNQLGDVIEQFLESRQSSISSDISDTGVVPVSSDLAEVIDLIHSMRVVGRVQKPRIDLTKVIDLIEVLPKASRAQKSDVNLAKVIDLIDALRLNVKRN